jgi:protein SCO1
VPARIRTFALLAPLVAACADRPAPAPPGERAAVAPAHGLRGVLLGTPQPKPDFTLTDTGGRPFNLRAETEGKLTLLFYGYTHCPDVCPIHLANIGRVLQGLPSEVTSRIAVVFVTTDPARDTPERIRSWLDNFHRGFVGLTGTEEELRQAQLAAGLLPAARDAAGSDSTSYGVSHGAQVFAFTPDNQAHVVYPFGIRQADWANDLPILVNGWPE